MKHTVYLKKKKNANVVVCITCSGHPSHVNFTAQVSRRLWLCAPSPPCESSGAPLLRHRAHWSSTRAPGENWTGRAGANQHPNPWIWEFQLRKLRNFNIWLVVVPLEKYWWQIEYSKLWFNLNQQSTNLILLSARASECPDEAQIMLAKLHFSYLSQAWYTPWSS